MLLFLPFVRLRVGVSRICLNLLNLQRVPAPVLAKQHKPLITVEITESEVRKEVTPKIGVGLHGEGADSNPGVSQLFEQIGRIGPSPHWPDVIPRIKSDAAAIRNAENERLLPGGERLFFRLGRFRQKLGDHAENEILENDQMLNIFGDGPSLGRLAETPLCRSQPVYKLQQARFTRSELVDNELPFLYFHFSRMPNGVYRIPPCYLNAMRLIRGAPGSGKTALVFREFADAIRRNAASPRIVVPTATLVRHYQHELARSGLVFDPNTVVSLSRFALGCTPELSLVPATLVRALIRDALLRLQLPEFTQVSDTRGMADVVLETITRFENAACTPERLSKVRNLSAHGKAFLRVWKEVDAAIAGRGFATRGQIIRRAAQTIPTAAIWLDGFLKFSPLESDFVRAIAAACDLTLTFTESLIGGGPDNATRRLALELGASDHLLPAPPRHTKTIAVHAPTPEREADEIARRILELHANGAEFPGIAVALRDVEIWLPLLRSTFDRFGIPARYYFSTPARKHPVAIFLDGLMTCALNDWDFASTLTALRAHPAWGHSADFDRFDFRVREAIRGNGAQALLALCESDSLRSHIADCLKISAWRSERARPAVWQRRLEQLAESLYRPRTIPAPADYAAIETARSHAAGLRAWSAALDTAARFWLADAGPVTLDQFHAVVGDALESAGMQIPDDRRNVVYVMSAFEARQWQVRSLFVCGMTARDYPRAAAQNLLFPDADIDRLRNAGIPLRTSADEDRDEEELFESLRTRASQHLILTVSAHDSGGKTIVPSRNLDAIHVMQAPACRLADHPAAATRDEALRFGVITTPVLPGLADQHRTISLTGLEELAKCRFRFFSNRSLKLKSVPDRPDQRLQPRVQGSIFHEAMEAWLTDRTRDFVGLWEKTFDDYCLRYNLPRGYRLEVERILSRRIAQEVNASVRWPALRSETEVDCGLDFPGGVTITCRVDRIDHVGEGNCVIVDYKSGKVDNVDKLVESETSLQGPLYALAVREKKQLNPVAMVFLAIREGKPVGWGAVPGANLDLLPIPPDWIDSARDRTIARLQSFLAGDVHAEPTSPDDCKWCDFKNACRIEQTEIVRIGVAGAD